MYLLTPCPGRSGTDLAELPHLEPSRWTSGQRWKPRHTSRRAVQRSSPRHALPNFPPHPLNLPTAPPAAPSDSPWARHRSAPSPPVPSRRVPHHPRRVPLQPRPPRALGSSILRPDGPQLYSPAWYPRRCAVGLGAVLLRIFAGVCFGLRGCFFFKKIYFQFEPLLGARWEAEAAAGERCAGPRGGRCGSVPSPPSAFLLPISEHLPPAPQKEFGFSRSPVGSKRTLRASAPRPSCALLAPSCAADIPLRDGKRKENLLLPVSIAASKHTCAFCGWVLLCCFVFLYICI